jgi:hypothetical protein
VSIGYDPRSLFLLLGVGALGIVVNEKVEKGDLEKIDKVLNVSPTCGWPELRGLAQAFE